MTWSRRPHPVVFDDIAYRSYTAAATALAPRLGLSTSYVVSLLRCSNRLSGCAEAALRDRETKRKSEPTPRAKPVIYNNQVFKTYAAAARSIGPTIDRPFDSVRVALSDHHGDVEAVLEYFRRISLVVAGKSYRNRTDFGRRTARAYNVPARKMASWVHSKRTPDEILELARAWHSARTARPEQIILFGWRFSSWGALYRYYTGSELGSKVRAKWRDHVASGRPTCVFPPLATKIVRLWEWGDLDKHNRFPSEIEATMPRSCLPLNAEPEEITDPMERAMATEMRVSARRSYERFLADPMAGLAP